MVIAEKPITAHSLHRDRLFSHSKEMIESGDRLQACEKIWGAVAHALKVVADRRGWSYESHVDALVIAAHVGRLTDDDAWSCCSAARKTCMGTSTRTRCRWTRSSGRGPTRNCS